MQSTQTQVRIIVGASAYACIKTETQSLDVRLSAGRSAAVSMRETAAEMKAKAARLLANADLIESAAELV